MTLLHTAFWAASLLALYSYLIYPLVLRALPTSRPGGGDDVVVAKSQPGMTLIITAHNEGARIREKLVNVLALPKYPGELEILVASDASTDDTDSIVKEFADQAVTLVRNSNHDGKEAAQGLAIQVAKGDLLVFSDVATRMEGEVLNDVAAHFADPAVGAISSTDRFIDRGGKPAGEGAYVRYEMWLRRQESRVGSLIGLSGSFFAARTEICRKQWATNIPSDLMTAINCVRQGYVAIPADNVFGYYQDLADPSKEYRRKVRTVVRGMRALIASREVLSVSKFKMFAFQVWSHKVMRWAAPWFLALAFILNVALLGEYPIYTLAMIAQVALYGAALAGYLMPSLQNLAVIRIPFFFVSANVAVAHALCDVLRGHSAVTWTPSER